MGKAENDIDCGIETRTATESPAARIAQLEKEIAHHKDLYYNQAEPEISDAEFDALEEELRNLRQDYPELAPENTVLDQVGADFTDTQFEAVTHKTPMLSLDKVHTEEDLKDWLDKHPGQKLAVWPKFDGVSLSLTYENGELVRAASRGDGTIGEDITANAIRVDGVRRTLDQKIDCEIRGEVVMLRSEFEAYNQAHPDKPLSNPRNGAAGALRLKDPKKDGGRKLQFYAFDVIIDDDSLPLNEQLEQLGFPPEGYVEADDSQGIMDYIGKIETDRDTLNYEIDGIVIKIADPDRYRALGSTSKHPRGAMAMKLAAAKGESEIESVEWAVGKTGKVSPRAKIKTLFLGGTNINYATLHNPDDIKRKGIRLGQRIQIKRAGDVIPYIIGPARGHENEGTPIQIPTHCPSCGSTLLRVGESNQLQCDNSAGCPAQNSKRIENWTTRGGADIEGLSGKTLTRLEDAGKVNKISDIYKLKIEDISSLEGMGQKSAENIIQAIEEKKNIGLRKAIVAWSIPNASKGTATRLCRNGYETPEQIAAASVEELSQVEDIGPTVAESLHKFFNDPVTQKEIQELRASGVNLDILDEDKPVQVRSEAASGPLAGKKVLLTGKLSVSRSAFQKELEAAGAIPVSSISANTDYLIAGEKAGSKLAKAEKLGVQVLDEAAARVMIA